MVWWYFQTNFSNLSPPRHIWCLDMSWGSALCERSGRIKVSSCLCAALWTGRQAEDLNPCLEQSRTSAAGKLSSVPSSASAHSPSHRYIGGRNCFVRYLFFAPLPSEVGVATCWNRLSGAKHSFLVSVSCPGANVRLAELRHYCVAKPHGRVLIQMHVWKSNTFVSVGCRRSQMLNANWTRCCPCPTLSQLCSASKCDPMGSRNHFQHGRILGFLSRWEAILLLSP